MIAYINEIKRQLHEKYGCPLANKEMGVEAGVLALDGLYPMEINGKTDYVRIKRDRIFCCRKSDEEPLKREPIGDK